MSRDTAVAEARRLQQIMAKHGVKCTIELKAGRPWSGDDWYSKKSVLMNHHTAGSMNGLTPSYALCRNGRSGLPGPLCNGYGGRDFVYRIITMGLGNHPGAGGPLNVAGFRIPKDSARITAWGTEWEHDGRSPWPPEMQEFMGRANAALIEWMGVPVERSIEHSTWASGRKIDRNGYDPARGQEEIRRFSGAEGSTPPPPPPPAPDHSPILKRGSRGPKVADVQRALHLPTDGIFGPATEAAVKKFQQQVRLTADGVVGPDTWAALRKHVHHGGGGHTPAPKPAPPAYPGVLLRRGSKGKHVVTLQRRLIQRGHRIAADGDYGPATESAVKRVQAKYKIAQDGIVGPQSWKAIFS